MSGSPRSGEAALAVSRTLLFAAVGFFLFVVVAVVLLHLYARWRWGRVPIVVLGPYDDVAADAAPARGLDPAALRKIPVRVYKAEDFGDRAVECAVCLSEVADGEKLRVLPKCNHGFHVDCVDMWFLSHATCPLCRDAVGGGDAGDGRQVPVLAEASDYTPLADVLSSWENQSQTSSGGAAQAARDSGSGCCSSRGRDGELVIDIPRRVLTAEDLKSPLASTPTRLASTPARLASTPTILAATPTRLASLRRFLSREKSCSGCSSPHDLEHGIVQKTNNDF